jgi:hypothetical protein
MRAALQVALGEVHEVDGGETWKGDFSTGALELCDFIVLLFPT